jgi:DNA-binding HxlR family transcriptional regulator
MSLTSLADWNCSIAKTLDVVGEWWALLILRDAFAGTRRFDDFQASLGLARSVLTARLQKLTDHGILERRPVTARAMAVEIANATFAARRQAIWGAGSTAVACDSTHFGAFDQNIFTEWHARYGGRGVLIY